VSTGQVRRVATSTTWEVLQAFLGYAPPVTTQRYDRGHRSNGHAAYGLGAIFSGGA
jgi:hypothetical protein